MSKILTIVDFQNDFCDGSLGTQKEQYMSASRYLGSICENYDCLILTRDYHPKNHCSFVENGGKWPKHCIQDDYGSDFHWSINKTFDLFYSNEKETFIINKGTNPYIEEYGASPNEDIDKYVFNNEVEQIDITGIALEYCVKETYKLFKKAFPDVESINILFDGVVAIDNALDTVEKKRNYLINN